MISPAVFLALGVLFVASLLVGFIARVVLRMALRGGLWAAIVAAASFLSAAHTLYHNPAETVADTQNAEAAP